MGRLHTEATKASDILKAVVLCCLYMAVGPFLMVLNKEILQHVGFPYPLLVSSLGLIFATLVTHTMKAAGKLELKHVDTITREFYIRKCLPVGVCHAATLAFGNYVYLFMGMSLIQFMKSFTPMVTAITAFFILGRQEKPLGIIALILVCTGTCISIGDLQADMRLTGMGLIFSVGSSVTEAVRLVMTDMLLSGFKMDVLENMYYLAPAGAVSLFCTGLFLEAPVMVAAGHAGLIFKHPIYFFLAATLGLGVQLLTTAVIKATSATTLKVLGQVRNVIPVLCGVMLYKEIVTSNQAAGYLLSVLAFGWYTYLKMSPKQQEPPRCDSEVNLKDIEAAEVIAGAGQNRSRAGSRASFDSPKKLEP